MLARAATSYISSLVGKTETNGRIRRFVDLVLEDEKARQNILHRVGARNLHDDKLVHQLAPAKLKHDPEFADLAWLLSSNYANRGISALMLDEAIWLHQTVKAISDPRVVELGRAKGGTTFLLAASGANVLSVDDGGLEESNARHFGQTEMSYDESLAKALAEAGLTERVQLVTANAETYSLAPVSFDLIFSDVPLPQPDRLNKMFDRWWAGLKPGGRYVLRDGRESRTTSVGQLALSLRDRPDVGFEEPAPGVFTVLVKTQA